MDRGTAIRADNAAGGRGVSGQLKIEMGEKKTIHDWRSFDRGCLSVGTGLDGRDSAAIREGNGDGW